MEEPKNAKLFLALKSRYALHNTDRLVEFILDDQKTSFDFITEIIPQIEEENKNNHIPLRINHNIESEKILKNKIKKLLNFSR